MSEYVLNTGPMVVGFDSFPVYWYKKGIITDCKNRTSASMIGVIVGVDNEHRTPYWTIRMALGNEWGEDGYMRIAKGKGLCGIGGWGVTVSTPSGKKL